jgi:transcription initiation factor TFIID subunit 11
MTRPGGSSKDDEAGEEGALGNKNKKDSQEEERMKMQLLVSNFSEEQLNRYEMFRRAAFPKASIKRLMQSIAGAPVSQSVVIAMSGIAKVYVGEIVETALDVLENLGQTGPLQPKHIREAVRRIKQKNGIPTTKHKKTLFH